MGLSCKECDSKLFKFGIVLGSSEFKEFVGVGGNKCIVSNGHCFKWVQPTVIKV